MANKILRTEYMKNPNELHRAYYAQFVTGAIKIAVVNRFGLARLQGAYRDDVHLNEIALAQWDRLARQLHTPALDAALGKVGDFWMLSGGICLLKEAAIQIVEAAQSTEFTETVELVQGSDGVWEPPTGSILFGSTLVIPADKPETQETLITVYAFFSDMEDNAPSLYTPDKVIVEHLKTMHGGGSDWIEFVMPEQDFNNLFSLYASRYVGTLQGYMKRDGLTKTILREGYEKYGAR